MRIKLEEMKEENKIKFIEEQKKSCLYFWKLMRFHLPMAFVFLSIVIPVVVPEASKLALMFIPCFLGCFYLTNYAKNRFKKIVAKGDELLKERVFVGYAYSFEGKGEVEFEIDGEEVFTKNFKGTSFQRYDGKKKVQIMYIPSSEKWFMDEV